MNFFQRLFCGDLEEKFNEKHKKLVDTIETLHDMYGTEKGKLSNLQVRIATYLHSKYKIGREFKLSANKLNISETAFRNLIKDLKENGLIEVLEKEAGKDVLTKKVVWKYIVKLKDLAHKTKLATDREIKKAKGLFKELEEKLDKEYEKKFGAEDKEKEVK